MSVSDNTNVENRTTGCLVSERYIQRMIEILREKGKTIILITHHLSTVHQADKIIVLENGTMVEEGTHFELLNNKLTTIIFGNSSFRCKQVPDISYQIILSDFVPSRLKCHMFFLPQRPEGTKKTPNYKSRMPAKPGKPKLQMTVCKRVGKRDGK